MEPVSPMRSIVTGDSAVGCFYMDLRLMMSELERRYEVDVADRDGMTLIGQ
jgi:hypothetical protein